MRSHRVGRSRARKTPLPLVVEALLHRPLQLDGPLPLASQVDVFAACASSHTPSVGQVIQRPTNPAAHLLSKSARVVQCWSCPSFVDVLPSMVKVGGHRPTFGRSRPSVFEISPDLIACGPDVAERVPTLGRNRTEHGRCRPSFGQSRVSVVDIGQVWPKSAQARGSQTKFDRTRPTSDRTRPSTEFGRSRPRVSAAAWA